MDRRLHPEPPPPPLHAPACPTVPVPGPGHAESHETHCCCLVPRGLVLGRDKQRPLLGRGQMWGHTHMVSGGSVMRRPSWVPDGLHLWLETPSMSTDVTEVGVTSRGPGPEALSQEDGWTWAPAGMCRKP